MSANTGQNSDPEETLGAESIEVLKGLGVVRKRPGLYIGNTNNGLGLQNLVFTLIGDVLADKEKNGCTAIKLGLNTDGSVSIFHDGHLDLARWQRPDSASAIEAMMTTLAVGVHNGHCIVNALSSQLNLVIWQDGKEYAIDFANGEPVGPVKITNAQQAQDGVHINFIPSPEIFASRDFDDKAVYQKLRDLMDAYPRVKFVLEDLRSHPAKRAEMLYEGQKDLK